MNVCIKCDGHCCKKYAVLITATDALRIAQAFPTLPPITYLQFVYLDNVTLKSRGYAWVVRINQTQDGLLGIRNFKDDRCFFLTKRGRCKIQQLKPLVCALYPYNTKEPVCPPQWEWTFDAMRMKAISQQYALEDAAYRGKIKKWNRQYSDRDFESFLHFISGQNYF